MSETETKIDWIQSDHGDLIAVRNTDRRLTRVMYRVVYREFSGQRWQPFIGKIMGDPGTLWECLEVCERHENGVAR
jgi:hypothetical protein